MIPEGEDIRTNIALPNMTSDSCLHLLGFDRLDHHQLHQVIRHLDLEFMGTFPISSHYMGLQYLWSNYNTCEVREQEQSITSSSIYIVQLYHDEHKRTLSQQISEIIVNSKWCFYRLQILYRAKQNILKDMPPICTDQYQNYRSVGKLRPFHICTRYSGQLFNHGATIL